MTRYGLILFTRYLDYMHARYYSPGTGRFLSVDSHPGYVRKPQSWNRYAYALNNPLKFIDPDGNVTYLVIGKPLIESHFPYVNPFGHIALAINDKVYSYGTNYTKGPKYVLDWGRSLSTYLEAQKGKRETVVAQLKVTPQQEAELQKYLDENNPNAKGQPGYSIIHGNTCVTVCRTALLWTEILSTEYDYGDQTPYALWASVYEAGLVTSEMSGVDFLAAYKDALKNFAGIQKFQKSQDPNDPFKNTGFCDASNTCH